LLTIDSLTGESEPQRRATTPGSVIPDSGLLFELENFFFKGTGITSGSGLAVIVKTGDGETETSPSLETTLTASTDTFLASIMKQLDKDRPLNSFQRGIRNVSYMMIGFMLVMVPIVSFFIFFTIWKEFLHQT
jgi:Mg2+-importing ATPase